METLNQVWSPAPKDLTVADHEVHVWRASLELPSSQVQRLRGILTDDELDRAKRFSFERDRQRFIAARGILRSILSHYITINPGDLRFYYNQYGKPFLAPDFSSYLLNFNLSHSGHMALYAITRNREIGVDVERVHSGFACDTDRKEAGSFLSLLDPQGSIHQGSRERFVIAFGQFRCFLCSLGTTHVVEYQRCTSRGLSLDIT